MAWEIAVLIIWMLARTDVAMDAASDACRLFVTCVMPGLLPYMTLSQMLITRIGRPMPASAVILIGWGGGSPTGAALLHHGEGLPAAVKRRIAVSCATMSPMFLLGTLSGWLSSRAAAFCIFAGVLAGGWLAGRLAGKSSGFRVEVPKRPVSFGTAVESVMRTMLLVCGTMAVLRMTAALITDVLPPASPVILPITTLLEVTTGAQVIAGLPLPLHIRAAILAAATGFGGAAIILQNHAVMPEDTLGLIPQILWQALHAVFSFLITLGLGWLIL